MTTFRAFYLDVSTWYFILEEMTHVYSSRQRLQWGFVQLINTVDLLVLVTQCIKHILLPDESLCHTFFIDNHLWSVCEAVNIFSYVNFSFSRFFTVVSDFSHKITDYNLS